MKFLKSTPILYSTDVSKSIAYFTEQLKFENKWEWDTPPTFGGVYRDEVEIFFCIILKLFYPFSYGIWLFSQKFNPRFLHAWIIFCRFY